MNTIKLDSIRKIDYWEEFKIPFRYHEVPITNIFVLLIINGHLPKCRVNNICDCFQDPLSPHSYFAYEFLSSTCHVYSTLAEFWAWVSDSATS